MKGSIMFDGGILPNPEGGFFYHYGWVLKADGRVIHEGSDLEVREVNAGSCYAEAGALERALQDALTHLAAADRVEILGDSQSTLETFSATATPRSSSLAVTKRKTDEMLSQLSNVSFRWIPREFNSRADRLGRDAVARDPAVAERRHLMSRINSRARAKFGNFFDSIVLSEWIASVAGQKKLSRLTREQLQAVLARVHDIPTFICDYVNRRNTVAQADPVRSLMEVA